MRFCLKNIFRKKLRTFLTALAVSIGVCSVIVIRSAGVIGTEIVNDELDSMGLGGILVTCSNQSGKSDKLTEDEVKIIEECENIEATMPVSVSVSEVSLKGESTECILWGVDEKAGDIISLKVLYGRMFDKSDILSNRRVCMVDSATALATYKRTNIVGKTVSINIDGAETNYTVVGVVDAESSIFQNVISDYVSNFVYVPVSQLAQSYDRVAVKIKDNGDIDKVGETIETSLNSSNGQFVYEAQNLAKQRSSLNQILSTVTVVLSAIGGISLFVAGITILTAMMMSVNEQTGEIGIKKAIGASNMRIMGEVIFESFFISIVGCVFGIAVALLLIFLVCSYFGLIFTPNITIIFGTVVFTFAVSIIFSVFPAFKAARLNPVEALRRD